MYNPNVPVVPTVDNSLQGVQTYLTIVVILSFVIALLVYFLFLKPSNEDNLSGFLKKLYNFLSFKTMTLEMVMKILYLFSATCITLFSLSLITKNFVSFLVMLIVGNIIVRLIAEWSLVFLMMYKNTNDIRNFTKNKK